MAMITIRFIVIILIANINIKLNAQCDTGSEPECQCSTAQVLCSVNELDGFSGQMSTFQHPNDGPNGFCGPSVSNNPTWFTFIAWCSDITMDVDFSNCVPVSGSTANGVQVVVFDGCSSLNAVDCDASCSTSGGSATLDLNNLTIGQSYHFMIDGCAGAACDYTISVTPTDCNENIEDWTGLTVTGATNVCIDSDEVYSVESLTGATSYHWSIDGNEVQETNNPTTTITWDTEGTYELCVDVSNICVETSEDPMEICTEITVADPGAGMLTSSPNPLCPGEISTVTVSGFNQESNYTQSFIITDPNGIVLDVLNVGNSSIDVTYDACGDIKVYGLNFASTATISLPSIGADYSGSDCQNVCCDEVCETITFDDIIDPIFSSPPADITLTCTDIIAPIMDLMVTDNCSDNQLVMGTESGSITVCDGGTIMREWQFTDDCGNTTNYTQTITSDPADEAVFLNVPADMTMDCSDFQSFTFLDLMYSNASTGTCLIEGMTTAVITDNTDDCDGTVEAEWTYTDDCNRTITETQVITINPPLIPVYINLPPDMTVNCNNLPLAASPLDYTNSLSGDCLITGMQDPTIENNFDACGGDITNSWELTDPCGRLVLYEQVITVDPAPEAVFLSLPLDITMSCEDFNNFSPAALDYSNMESGPCEISGSEDAIENGSADGCGGSVTYSWTFNDDCGRSITHVQVITVDPADAAEFLNIPSDVTLDCSGYDITPPSLSYDNEAPGLCQIDGEILAIESGNVSECGGLITYTWTFTDDCSRTITESQDIEYLPASEPEFIDPPEDITVACDDDVPDADDLEYSNNEDGICDITGDATPSILTFDNIYEYTWEYINNCTGNTLIYTQTIVKNIPIELEDDVFEFTLCLQGSIDLGDIFINDLNSTELTITYHERLPPSDNNEVDPVVTLDDDELEFYIYTINQFGCEAIAEVILIADITEAAGSDREEEICKDVGIVDLFSILESTADPSGEFTQTDGPDNLDIFDPSQVNISDVEPGLYTIEYLVDNPSNNCPSDMAIIELEIFPLVEIEIISLVCNSDGQTYTLVITNNDYNVDVSQGTITSETPTEVIIDNIPIDQDITVEVQDQITRCEVEFFFMRPDCNCPMIDAPISNGNTQVCEGSSILQLSVTTEITSIANWYDAPVGGNLLLANSDSYTPTVSAVGLYTYYVEAESTDMAGCLSTTRTEVILEIIPRPAVRDTFIDICNNIDNSIIEVERTLLERIIFGNIPNLTADFYTSIDDREAGINAITFPDAIMQASEVRYVRVSNSANCQNDIIININVQDLPILSAVVTDVSCEGDEDGTIEYTVDSQAQPVQIVFRNDTLMDNLISDLRPESYTAIAIDRLGCRDTLTEVISDGLSLSIENLILECDNNGTTSDENDDLYNITFITENSIGLNGDYVLSINPSGGMDTYSYGETVNLQLPADGIAISISATDINNNCDISQDLGVLIPCSSDCLLTLNSIEYICDDNGTPTDVTDDFYNFSIIAASINGSSNNTYNVLLDGVVSYNFQYNEIGTFTIPAESQVVNIIAEDSQFNGCSQLETTMALIPCSNDCIIEYELTDINCDDNGTLDNNDDDTYSVGILIIATNGSTDGYSLSTGESGMYGDTLTLTGINISDGALTTDITDATDNNCVTSLSVIPPDPCSQPCIIEFASYNIISCDNNGTASDPLDDFYSVSFELATTLGITSMYIVNDNQGNQYGPFDYNMATEIGPFTANGSELILTFTDLENTTCFLQQSIVEESCSDECTIVSNIVSISCDNNDTDNTDLDDIYTVIISVDGLNISDMYTIPSLGITNLYSDDLIIDNLLIVDGAITFSIEDINDSNCFNNIFIDPPAPCSQPCDVQLTSLTILPCNNNMTGDTADDDNFSIDIEVEGILGNAMQYNLRDNQGNVYGPYDYNTLINIGPFAADGTTINLSLFDDTNGSCILDFGISSAPCSSCIQTVSIDSDISILTCDIDMANLNVVSSNIPSEISWVSDNGFSDTQESIQIFEAGEYTVTVTYPDGCTVTESIMIEADNEIPVADAGPDDVLNCIIDEIILDANSSINNATSSAQWMEANGDVISTDLTVTITEAGFYGLQIIDNANLCESDIDIVEISEIISAPSTEIFADPDSVINCFIEAINLTASEEANTIYTWIVEDGQLEQLSITVSDIDSVTLIALDTISNCQNERTIFIPNLTQFPIIELSPILGIDCISGESCVEVTTSTNDPITYNWYDDKGALISNAENNLCISVAGNYTIELTDNNSGCINSMDFTIPDAIIPSITIPSITTINNTDQLQLLPVVNIDSASINSIIWSSSSELSCNDCLSPLILNPIDGDTIRITVITDGGCETFATTMLSIVVTPEIYVPNIFSPQERSNFTIFSNDQISTIEKLSIYDRWGNLVFLNEDFVTNDPSQGWDGTYKDRNVEQGVYVYVFIYEIEGRKVVESGDLTLLR